MSRKLMAQAKQCTPLQMKFTGNISQRERSWSGGEIRLFSGISQPWRCYEREDRILVVYHASLDIGFETNVSAPRDGRIPISQGYPVTRPDNIAEVEIGVDKIKESVETTLAAMRLCAKDNKEFAYGDPRPGYRSYIGGERLKQMVAGAEEVLIKLQPQT